VTPRFEAEHGAEGDEPQADHNAVADEDVGQREYPLQAPPEQDQRTAAEVVGGVPTQVAGDRGSDRADQEADAELLRGRAEFPDRPDADERPAGRKGDGSEERHGEHRPQRPVDLVAPDEPEEAAEEAHGPIQANGPSAQAATLVTWLAGSFAAFFAAPTELVRYFSTGSNL
jgi:hypothetical protein